MVKFETILDYPTEKELLESSIWERHLKQVICYTKCESFKITELTKPETT